MIFKKLLLSLITISLGGIATSLEAEYYLDTLFPIGLTGLNNAGRPPFGNVFPPWTWDQGDRQEKQLIYDLGVNVIGCQDAKSEYLTDLTYIFA